MQRVRKGDRVVVIAGKDKGRKGEVMRLHPDNSRVTVAGVNVVTKHRKPDRQNQRGGIERVERPIHLSNVMLVDPQTDEPTRVRFKTLDSGEKVRIAVKSGEQIDS